MLTNTIPLAIPTTLQTHANEINANNKLAQSMRDVLVTAYRYGTVRTTDKYKAAIHKLVAMGYLTGCDAEVQKTRITLAAYCLRHLLVLGTTTAAIYEEGDIVTIKPEMYDTDQYDQLFQVMLAAGDNYQILRLTTDRGRKVPEFINDTAFILVASYENLRHVTAEEYYKDQRICE